MNSVIMPNGHESVLAFGGSDFDIMKFLNIRAPRMKEEECSKYISIKNPTKRTLLEVLKDRWMLYQLGRDSIYVKHVFSGRMDVLYQILLSGQDWDGIYEFALKGNKISVKGYVIDGVNTLVIESTGNYNLATFGDEKMGYHTICRMDYKTDEEFTDALIATGFVTKEDIEIYYKPDALIKPYLNKILPRVLFQ